MQAARLESSVSRYLSFLLCLVSQSHLGLSPSAGKACQSSDR